MSPEAFRAACLAAADEEKRPFDKFFKGRKHFLAYYRGGRIFCYFDPDAFDLCTLRCDPAKVDEIRGAYLSACAPYNQDPRRWIGVRFNEDMPDDVLVHLVERASELATSQGGGKRRKTAEAAQ